MKKIITLLSILFLFSCNNSNRNDLKSVLDEEIKFRGEVYNGYEDYELNNILVTTFVDTFPKNIKLSDFLTKRIKEGEFKIIDTERISQPYSKFLNGVMVCCSYDTTIIFSENIGNKKYIFIPNGYKLEYFNIGFNEIFEVINPKSNYTKKRIDIDLPLWGLKIGDYIDKDKIDTTIEQNMSSEGGIIRNQFLKSDKSINISTLNFENSNKLLITNIRKSDLTETEFNDFIDYIKSKYPFLEILKKEEEGSSFTKYIINYYGIKMIFSIYKSKYSNDSSFSFDISDVYTITKRIIENEGKKYKFNEGRKYIVKNPITL